jgi:hypothetical protein
MSNASNTADAKRDVIAEQRANLTRRYDELRGHHDCAMEDETRAILAAIAPGTDDVAEQRRLEREMSRATRATAAVADAMSRIALQIGKLDLGLSKIECDLQFAEIRRDERAKREAIRTAMAEDKRAANALAAEQKLMRDAAMGASTPSERKSTRGGSARRRAVGAGDANDADRIAGGPPAPAQSAQGEGSVAASTDAA